MTLGREKLRDLLSRAWRLQATALCFGIFGLCSLLFTPLWFRLLPLAVRNPQLRVKLSRRCISLFFRCFLQMCRCLGVFDYRFEGFGELQAERGIVLAANHPTFLDYVLIASRLPETDCIIKSGLERNFFLSSMIKSADYLINSRHEELLPLSQQRLQQGECILIFPEGTRTVPGRELRLRRGCANIALRCHCDLRLIRICCSEPYLAKNMKWYNLPRRRPLI